MWLFFAILLNVLLAYVGTLYVGFFWVLMSAFVYVTLTWFRGSHVSGIDTFETFRAMPLWRWFSPILEVKGGSDFIQDIQSKDRYIFILMQNVTNASLFWFFGLHGRWNWITVRLCYMMPQVFFFVPVLREVLILSGACAATTPGRSDVQRVLELTELGKNVAYASSGMRDALNNSPEIKSPALVIFQQAIARGYHVVPCVCTGERERRYVFFQDEAGIVCTIREWFLNKIGYPFPLFYFPRYGQKIELSVGPPLSPLVYNKDPSAMQHAFLEKVKQMTSVC